MKGIYGANEGSAIGVVKGIQESGKTGVVVVDAIDGKSLPKTVDTGYFWYDKTNIDQPEIQAVLYKVRP
ncbi:hypothetical protein GCM10009557_24470 [Virgisporangium ochraceum]|uniref:Uncharacterized protein n=1 Tax=Virgisporangium ochraceum TaxID=65505 RepID=A0A8J3ZT58_9ACTN|nr:hypothetical protein [Virgisporangium ochraceum]GIJ67011.1 hypothetical protein Voc01_019280 [Virgisporangium ochraceum]